MAIALWCPNPECRSKLLVDEKHLGRQVRCTKCARAFVVETPSADDYRETVTYTPDDKGVPGRVGRFIIRERLGAGGFGTVFRATDPELDRDVALKIPHQSTSNQPRRLERFGREAKAAARLRHPHIVPG